MKDHGVDEALSLIADYVTSEERFSDEAYRNARLALADSLGCAIYSLKFKACTKLLGPTVAGTIVPFGARVPGTHYILDPIVAAFNIGLMIRWLDFNDTWLGQEWGHPSDNMGGLLAIGDYISQKREKASNRDFCSVEKLLNALIKAYEIQGGLALLNSFNQIGFDHVILVKVATAAVTAWMLGCNRKQIINAVSNAWIDTGSLRTYRHAPATGSRKSWAGGDATSRGLFFALLAQKGEMGYPHALTAKQWGFYDVMLKGKPFVLQRPFKSYVIENILFKPVFPAEYHAQTAIEAAFKLHPTVIQKFNTLSIITIETHASALRIIDKTGPLQGPADKDHCLQYMVAIGLLKGMLSAEDYEDAVEADPRIEMLRNKMRVIENPSYSLDYHDQNKRTVANAITLHFADETMQRVEVEYPLGHPKRRTEATPLLFEKFEKNVHTYFSESKTQQLSRLFQNHQELSTLSVAQLMALMIDNQ